MKKILLLGAFDFSRQDTGGQPVKSRELYYALCEYYGEQNIDYVETMHWKKNPFKLFFNVHRKACLHDYLIMLPAHNGVKIFSYVLAYYKKIKKKKIYYDVIGGWLPDFLHSKPILKKALRCFDGIWVETSSMEKALHLQGLDQVVVLPNFKKLQVLEKDELLLNHNKPYPLCTFSRVMKEKGIEDAIDAVIAINTEHQETIFSLDIYGQIDSRYREEFENIQLKFPKYIVYKGVIPPSKSVETLKNYFAILFPTHYFTEGIPGTLLDAYAAGVPVITSLWLNSADVFKEGETGWGYKFDDSAGLTTNLRRIYKNPRDFLKMKETCLDWSKKYKPEVIVKQIDGLLSKR